MEFNDYSSWESKEFFVEPEIKEITLYCDNPQCLAPIKDMQVAYDKRNGKVYHIGGCGIIDKSHRDINFADVEYANIDYIKDRQALRLLVKNGLRQSQMLEQRV